MVKNHIVVMIKESCSFQRQHKRAFGSFAWLAFFEVVGMPFACYPY